MHYLKSVLLSGLRYALSNSRFPAQYTCGFRRETTTMKSVYILSFISLVCLSTCYAKDLIVGTTYNGRLIWQEKAEYMGIPFKKRVKEIFFSDPGMQTIKGIVARDLDHTEGLPSLTAGGVGFSYMNMRLKSPRGSGLNYQIEVYV